MRRDLLTEYGIQVDVEHAACALALGVQQMVALARAVSINARVVIMDEPTSSLEPREVRPFSRHRPAACARHRHHLRLPPMDEIFRGCDDVTVLRDGEGRPRRRPARPPPAQLVSLMLGKPPSRRSTAAGHSSRPPPSDAPGARGRRPQPQAPDRAVSLTSRPGEVSRDSAACWAAAGPRHSRRLSGAEPRPRHGDGRWQAGAQRLGARCHHAPASSCCPKTARARDRAEPLGARQHRACRTAQLLSRGGFTSDGAIRCRRRRVHQTPAHQGVQPRPDRSPNSRAGTSRR